MEMSTVEVGGVDSFWLPFTLTEEVHRNLRDATKEEEKWRSANWKLTANIFSFQDLTIS
jgi:hypothetical protein